MPQLRESTAEQILLFVDRSLAYEKWWRFGTSNLIAIILSAGQGTRLLPYTETLPKCLLSVDSDQPALEVQLRALAACSVTDVCVMVGFQAEKVDQFLATQPVAGMNVHTLFNRFYDTSDNLVTAWLARPEMKGDFLLMNGDTLFEPAVLRRLLNAPSADVTLVINEKGEYDDDDMKVATHSTGHLRTVSKQLDLREVDAESIGLMRFQGAGVELFRDALDRAVRSEGRLGSYYLSVIDGLAREGSVETVAMTGLWWNEMDCPEDLHELRAGLAGLRDRRWLSEEASVVEERGGRPRSRVAAVAELPPLRLPSSSASS